MSIACWSGGPVSWARPPRRAAGSSCQSLTRAARDTASAATSANAARHGLETAMPERAATRKRMEKTMAAAPNVPTRLSSMISSLRSAVTPPPKPSAVSARPSSCRPPVRSIVAPTASPAATSSGSPSATVTTSTTPPIRPTAAPTTGKTRAPRRKLGAAAGLGPSRLSGMRVRKAVAAFRSSTTAPASALKGSSVLIASAPAACGRSRRGYRTFARPGQGMPEWQTPRRFGGRDEHSLVWQAF